MTASSGPRTPGGGPRIPRPSRPPERESEQPVGTQVTLCRRAEPESSLLSSAERGWEARDRAGLGCGRGGEEGGVPGGDPAPRAGPGPPAPLSSPPNTHPEVKSCCTLSSRSRKVSSIAAAAAASPPLRSQAAAAALAPRTCHPRARTRAARPAPGRPSAPPQPLPRFGPARRSGPAPRRSRRRSGRAGLGCEKGRSFPPRQESERLGLLFLFQVQVVSRKKALSQGLF